MNDENLTTTAQPEQPVQEPSIQPEQPTQPEPQEPTQQPDLGEGNEIGVDANGELTLSDSFFDDEAKPDLKPEVKPEVKSETEQPQAAQDYTDDELRNIPFEQWSPDRIKGDVARYMPIVQEQIARRQAQANYAAQQAQIQQQQAANAPKPYTAQELSAAAQKLVKQRLNLAEDDEVDMYEPEHYAAMQQAVSELNAARQNEIKNFQSVNQAQASFGNFWADLSARSDFNDFDNWITQVLAQNGKSPDIVVQYVQQTGDYAGAQRTLMQWYQSYQMQRSKNVGNVRGTRSTARVPSIENANNAAGTGGRAFNLASFREMSDDQQVQALINGGYAGPLN